GADLLDRPTRSQVLRLSRLEEVKDVLRACRRPQGEELVIRIGEGPTAADRHETRVAVFREDHHAPLLLSYPRSATSFSGRRLGRPRGRRTNSIALWIAFEPSPYRCRRA